MSDVQLILGDCLDVLREMPDGAVDCVVTDPPYGNDTNYATYEDSRENLAMLVKNIMPEILRVARRALITCGVANIHLYPQPDWILSWNTPAGTGSGRWGFCCWQPILAYGKDPYMQNGLGRRPDSLTLTKASEKSNHPCPKPVEVMRWIVRRGTMEGDTILDPFLGSGTTAVAAILEGRRAIGVEIDPAYYAIAEKRIAQAQAQPPLIPHEAQPAPIQHSILEAT